MDWLSIGIQIGVLIITIVLAWAKFGTKLALLVQDVSEIKGNHLKHIESDMRNVKDDMVTMKLAVARIEEHLKK